MTNADRMKINYPIFLKRTFLVVSFFFFVSAHYSQVKQVVKGVVTDKESGIGLPGVIVRLIGPTQTFTYTDSEGRYRFAEVPVGRQSFVFMLTGYKSTPVNDVVISSGKEMILNVDMEEVAIQMENVVVTSGQDTDVVSNMQVSNMKTFSIEETERYAGSRQDPARMAQNFAGVQGSNDSRNDIVIRGNSPSGLLWRLEDVDIPNPNHFAVAGSAGGPQSIINNKYLSNSEFYTGAFPAQYGNALGGVFDLKMRNGNNEKHERTFQLGILGTELALEGPINKKSGSSYMITYRYSTLALFGSFNINLGTSAIPYYQDGSVRLNFPTKKAGVFSFTGIGGLSQINILLSTQTTRPKELYGDQNRDQLFGSNMGVGILSNVYAINNRTMMKTTLAYALQEVYSRHYLVIRRANFEPKFPLPKILHYNFYENKGTLAWYVRSKLNARNSIRTGLFVNHFDVNFFDKIKINSLFDTVPEIIDNKAFKVREQIRTQFFLIQPYLVYVHKFDDKLSVHTGLFMQYLTLNNSFVIEPRASIRYQASNKHVFSLSYGMHSQMQSTYLYFTIPDTLIKDGVRVANTNRETPNTDLGFTRAQHLVAGYDYQMTRYFRLKTELYYQSIWNAPVYAIPSAFSALNRGATFNRFYPIYTLVNGGTGYNYGIEVTLEKLHHNHYFFLFSGSLYQSKYKGSNGVEHNSDYNGVYMTNALGGLEYNVGKSKRNVLSFGTKLSIGGGRRYSPVNIAASNAIMDIVPDDDAINSLQFRPYNRIDFHISYKINGKKMHTEIAFDLLNVLDTKNVLALSYTPDPANLSNTPYTENYQLGQLPIVYVKFDF